MAKNEKDKELARAQNAQKKKEQAYRAQLKRLDPHPYVAAGLLLLALLLFFLSWGEIYNVDIPGVEIRFSGFSAAICGLTGNYTMPEGIYGMMAAFYYWAPEQCAPLGVMALVSLITLVLALVLCVAAALGKRHALEGPAAILALVSAGTAIAGFALAMAMTEPLITGYCSGNPACSVRSYALIPAVLAVLAAAVCCFAFIRYLAARKTLK